MSGSSIINCHASKPARRCAHGKIANHLSDGFGYRGGRSKNGSVVFHRHGFLAFVRVKATPLR
jgi:hypothetical protein